MRSASVICLGAAGVVALSFLVGGSLAVERSYNRRAPAQGQAFRPHSGTNPLSAVTPAYRAEVVRAVLAEANKVAKLLGLPERLPIREGDLVGSYVPSRALAEFLGGAPGNITTSNYTYYVSVANRFSFLTRTHLQEGYFELQERFLWPAARIDTNAAYQLATQWLRAISVDVDALNRDLVLEIQPMMPRPGCFVPVYWVLKGVNP